jgi:hypothetical protein
MLKRKFGGFECVFCLGDEDFAYVDLNQFQLCNVYSDTKENVAICLKRHEKLPNDNFAHIPLGCKLENPDAFIEFLETKKCGENTNFVEWKSVLSYLGCSKKIMDKLKMESKKAKDEISIVSAFYAFETVQKKIQVENFTVSLDRLDFFMAYRQGDLTLTRTVSPPQNVPQELLDKLKPDEIILNGLSVFPGMNFVESIFVNVIILNTCNQYENCKKMCQLLLDLKFVIIVESLIHWRCIPPFDKISQWNPIMITAVTYNNGVEFMENVKCYDYLFYYSNPFTLVSTIKVEHFVKTGLIGGTYPNDAFCEDKLLGIPISPTVEISTSELEKARFDVLMQTPHPCANFLDLALLKDVEKIPIPRHYLAEDKDEFAESVEYDEETQSFESEYPFPIRVREELNVTSWNHLSKNYTLATIFPSGDYDSICKSLSKVTSLDIVSSALYIDKIEQGWQHCKITGIVNQILTWDVLL